MSSSVLLPQKQLQRSVSRPPQPAPAIHRDFTPPGRLPSFIQASLRVGPVDDPLEHEADRVANHVTQSGTAPTLQRACASEGSGTPCSGCAEPSAMAPRVAIDAVTRAGRPIDRSVREAFEPSFGTSFEGVRVHDDAQAATAADSVGARAYTAGNHIVFAAGEYQPHSSSGQRTIAHELAHVVQQEGFANNIIRRKECSATRVCSPPDQCAKPDPSEKGSNDASTWWSLVVNVDVEAGDFEAALRSGRLGHTNVRFAESNGKQYTYGFYPAAAIPNENARAVDGCVNHPDTSHDECIDRAITYHLPQAKYQAALSYAQAQCATHHYYGLSSANVSYTCTTFASEVVKAAGKQLPSSASEPTTIFYQPVPAIDNPNTLNERLKERSEGIGSSESEALSLVEIAGESYLITFPWQEKARWITVLLTESWITNRDVSAVVKICTTGMAPGDLPKIKKAVSSFVDGMHSSDQQSRVRKALGG
ncbi:MAG: DUF4157 domain-containing protein [Candidatus Cybelea sp.]